MKPPTHAEIEISIELQRAVRDACAEAGLRADLPTFLSLVAVAVSGIVGRKLLSEAQLVAVVRSMYLSLQKGPDPSGAMPMIDLRALLGTGHEH